MSDLQHNNKLCHAIADMLRRDYDTDMSTQAARKALEMVDEHIVPIYANVEEVVEALKNLAEYELNMVDDCINSSERDAAISNAELATKAAKFLCLLTMQNKALHDRNDELTREINRYKHIEWRNAR